MEAFFFLSRTPAPVLDCPSPAPLVIAAHPRKHPRCYQTDLWCQISRTHFLQERSRKRRGEEDEREGEVDKEEAVVEEVEMRANRTGLDCDVVVFKAPRRRQQDCYYVLL